MLIRNLSCQFVHLDQQLGQNLARTFLDYYKSINYISCSPNSSLMPRLKEDRIKSRLTRQSTNMPIVNQDEATAYDEMSSRMKESFLFFDLDLSMVKHSI